MFCSKSSVILIVVLFVCLSQAGQFLLSNKYEGEIWVDGQFQTTNTNQASYNAKYSMGKGKQMIINAGHSWNGHINIKTWCTQDNNYCKYCGITEYCDLNSKQATILADITMMSGNEQDRISLNEGSNIPMMIIPMGGQRRSEICILKSIEQCPILLPDVVSKGTELKCTLSCEIISADYCCIKKHQKYPEFSDNGGIIYYKHHATAAYLITVNNTLTGTVY